ncbi:MAG: hypothetical protein R2809_12940 [Flavobacteriales bacterium]
MKKSISLFLLAFLFAFQALSQNISVSDEKMPLSKEASKAQKQFSLTFMGTYLPENSSEILAIYTYQPKKSPTMMDIVKIKKDGTYSETETVEFTQANLDKYGITLKNDALDNLNKDISSKPVFYVKGPALAGTPKVNVGHFENRYKMGVWSGYSFKEENDFDMDVKFWPYFTVGMGSEDLSNTNYLLSKYNMVSRFLQGKRNYVSANSPVLIGGMKAVMGSDVFFAGVYDTESKTWLKSQDIKFEKSIDPGFRHFHQDDNGNVHCVIGVGDHFQVLQFSPNGDLAHNVPLQIPLKGNTIVDCNIAMHSTDNEFTVAMSYYSGRTGGDPAIAISRVSEGKETLFSNITNEMLESIMISAPKSKAKFKKMKYLQMDKIEVLSNGDMLVFFCGAQGSNPINNYMLHLGSTGQAKACYQADPIPGDTAPQFDSAGHIDPLVEVRGDKVYWLIRSVPKELKQGMKSFSSTEDAGAYYVKTTTTLRVDEFYQLGSIVTIDLASKNISNQITPEAVLIGANPMRILENGSIVFTTFDLKKSIYTTLIVK